MSDVAGVRVLCSIVETVLNPLLSTKYRALLCIIAVTPNRNTPY